MHKRFVNHCTIELSLIPVGPILIKSGKEGADPTKPNMEFVEAFHKGGRTAYFPGSSLKGAIRAHAERIVRTVGLSIRPQNQSQLWASDPLSEDRKNNPNYYLDEWKQKEKEKLPKDRNLNPGAALYNQSCFISQLFGSTAVASRFRIEDAYPEEGKPIQMEERNGVAIDRILGSAAKGALFEYEVCTIGTFKTNIHLKNFSLAQLGLIGLVLRDLNDGWFGLGFAKSRGMGFVKVELKSATIHYPGCILQDDQIQSLGNGKPWSVNSLIGAGEFIGEERKTYGFPPNDLQPVEPSEISSMALGVGVQLKWQDEKIEEKLFPRAVEAWVKCITLGENAS